MNRPPEKTSSEIATEQLQHQLAAREHGQYVLRLYVTGTTPRSQRAIANIRQICEQHLQGRYELDVIDIYQQPALASREQIVAAPTLIKKLPLPLRRIVGDLSQTQQVLVGLELHPLATEAESSTPPP